MTLREEIARGENVALEFKGVAEGFAQAPQVGLGVCQRSMVVLSVRHLAPFRMVV